MHARHWRCHPHATLDHQAKTERRADIFPKKFGRGWGGRRTNKTESRVEKPGPTPGRHLFKKVHPTRKMPPSHQCSHRSLHQWRGLKATCPGLAYRQLLLPTGAAGGYLALQP
jgi:hypothetical protein